VEPFSATLADLLLFFFSLSLFLSLLARAIWRRSATNSCTFLLLCSFTFAVFHFFSHLRRTYLIVSFHFVSNSLRVPRRAAQPLRLHDDNANDETLHQRRVHGHLRRLGNLQPRQSQRIPMELSRLLFYLLL